MFNDLNVTRSLIAMTEADNGKDLEGFPKPIPQIAIQDHGCDGTL